jgi:HlyD family secretion protein
VQKDEWHAGCEGVRAMNAMTLIRPTGRRWLLLVPICAIGLAAFSKLKPLHVSATPVERGKAIEAVYATGTVEAEVRRTLRARLGGQVTEVRVQEGDHVKAGDLLLRIDATQMVSDVRRGRADLEAARAQGGKDAPHLRALEAQAKSLDADLKLARAERDRLARLGAAQAATASELERAQAHLDDLEAQLAANRAQARATEIDLSTARSRSAAMLDALTAKLDEAELRAPIDGVVLWRGVEPGEQVGRDQPLLRIGDTRSLIIEALVDEADIASVSDGSDGRAASTAVISLYAFPLGTERGKVIRVAPDAQRERKAFLVKLRLDTPPAGMRSGMSAEVNILAREKADVLVLPSEAVADGQVWTVRNGRARRVPVEIGIHDLLRSEVTRGLSAGDLVIPESSGLSDGRWVRPDVQPMNRRQPMPAPGAIAQSVM